MAAISRPGPWDTKADTYEDRLARAEMHQENAAASLPAGLKNAALKKAGATK
jgi:hypothetical protein